MKDTDFQQLLTSVKEAGRIKRGEQEPARKLNGPTLSIPWLLNGVNMRKTILPTLGIIGLLACAGQATPQVSARQGVDSPEVVNFNSPMVLDLTLPNIAAVPPDSQMQLPDVRKYICDKNVSLLNLAITKRITGRKSEHSLELIISGSVLVEASYDRRVDVTARIKSGDHVLASQTLRNVSAEEDRKTSFHVAVPIAESDLASAYAGTARPSLELTLTVRDDR